jgi:uncharacterized protein YbjT (DUF2867 family)
LLSVAAMILVTGATGKQGGAVARHLLARGKQIRILTRDPSSAAAQKLAAAGAAVAHGDLDDRASLDRAVAGATAMFSVQDPWKHGVAGELRQGKALADAAKQAGVRHVVYASVGYADRPTAVAHFESKGTLERYMREAGLVVTATRPAFFMESMLARHDRRARFALGALKRGLRGGKVQIVAVDDIGRIAAEAFDSPRDENIDLAGDELSFDEIVATFVRVTGKRPRVVDVPFVLLRVFSREAYENFAWIGAHGWRFADRRDGMTRFEPWLRDQLVTST